MTTPVTSETKHCASCGVAMEPGWKFTLCGRSGPCHLQNEPPPAALTSNQQSTWTPDELLVALLRADGPITKELCVRAADAIERLQREELRLGARLQEEREASRALAARIPPSETSELEALRVARDAFKKDSVELQHRLDLAYGALSQIVNANNEWTAGDFKRIANDGRRSADESRSPEETSGEPDWKRRYEDERAIVDRIWVQLGSPTYEQLAGRSIYDLIDELKRQPLNETEEMQPPNLASHFTSMDPGHLPPVSERDIAAMQSVINALYGQKATRPIATREQIELVRSMRNPVVNRRGGNDDAIDAVCAAADLVRESLERPAEKASGVCCQAGAESGGQWHEVDCGRQPVRIAHVDDGKISAADVIEAANRLASACQHEHTVAVGVNWNCVDCGRIWPRDAENGESAL